MDLLPSLVPFLQPFESQLTRPTFSSFCTLVSGWLLAARRHHVTGALRAACDPGSIDKHHSAYHRVFAKARWSLDAVGLALLDLICRLHLTGAGAGAVFVVIDDTLCPKRGRTMFGVDSHYDAANTGRKRSNANQSLKRRGHCWVMLGVVIQLPLLLPQPLCLPVLFRLYMNKNGARRNGQPYRSKPDLARDLLRLVCDHLSTRRVHALVDSAYGGQDTLRNLPANCDLTARWQTNARLFEPAPTTRAKGQKGRPRVRGNALPSPRQMLDDRCQRVTLDLYNRPHPMRIASCLACLYTVPGRLLRIVATEPLTAPGGTPRPKHRACFYSTATEAAAEQVLGWFALRWTVEVAIHDAKQQLGFDQPQGYSEPAVRRTAPTLMLLYSMVVLWFAEQGHRDYRAPRWPWYRDKTAISFADMLATLRSCTLKHHLGADIADPRDDPGSAKPLQILRRLLNLAA